MSHTLVDDLHLDLETTNSPAAAYPPCQTWRGFAVIDLRPPTGVVSIDDVLDELSPGLEADTARLHSRFAKSVIQRMLCELRQPGFTGIWHRVWCPMTVRVGDAAAERRVHLYVDTWLMLHL